MVVPSVDGSLHCSPVSVPAVDGIDGKRDLRLIVRALYGKITQSWKRILRMASMACMKVMAGNEVVETLL